MLPKTRPRAPKIIDLPVYNTNRKPLEKSIVNFSIKHSFFIESDVIMYFLFGNWCVNVLNPKSNSGPFT
jgi:hypothetical protein